MARPTSRAPRDPRRGAGRRTRSRRRARSSGWTEPPFDGSDDVLTAWREGGQARRGRHARMAPRTARGERQASDEFLARMAARSATPGSALSRQAARRPRRKVATRKASEMALEAINAAMPDDRRLGRPHRIEQHQDQGARAADADNYGGRYIYYGIREFGMAAAMNGMALHGGVIPYGGTFLVFTDYCRPAIRLSALQNARVIYVMTHDSIGLGEDGPTHQPIEHLQSLRAMPQLDVYRPADAVETAECWALALAERRAVAARADPAEPAPVRTEGGGENLCARGAYRLKAAAAAQGDPDRHRLGGRDRARRAERLKRRGSAPTSSPCPAPSVRRAGPADLSRGHPARRQQPRDPARVDRGRDDLRLGALHRAPRPAHRHRPLRRLGAGRRPLPTNISASPPTIADRGARHMKKRELHDESCNQRLRPHRPAGRPRDPRAARLRARAGRDQRPRRRQVQRLAVQARQRPRPSRARCAPTATT
jgi:hypothetical protein